MRQLLLITTLMPLLVGCSLFAPKPVPEPTASDALTLADVAAARADAADAEKLYSIDAASSDVWIYVFRGGRMPTRGKNHVIAVSELEGFVALRGELPTESTFMLGFRLEDLAVDPPALREATGGSFAEPLTDEQVEGTRDNMLGESVLDAERYPEVVLRSLAIGGDWPMLTARVAVSLHGQTQVYDTLMEVRHDDEQLRAEGSLVIRQTDFGIEPMTVLGGLLGLQDPLGIRFVLVARAVGD